MAMQLEKVVPFGRSLAEYRKMFNLTIEELKLNILGVGDGPTSFNAELTAQGGTVTSVDPIYAFDATEIRTRFEAVVDNIIEQIKQTPQDWVWSHHASPEALRASREHTLRLFVEDYDRPISSTRYVTGELPALPFADGQFDLALCSHFLFLYSDHLSLEFHQRSIEEMLRVAREIRIFPLLTLMLERSPYLKPLQNELLARGYVADIQPVSYELQKGGNEMLVVKRSPNRSLA